MTELTMPTILECTHYIAQCSLINKRYVKDYEFDFYVDGERSVTMDGVPYKLSKGSMVFRKPGQMVTGYGDYNAYMLTLDFSNTLKIAPNEYIRNRDSIDQVLCHPDVFNIIPDVFFPAHQQELSELYEKMIACSYPNIMDVKMQKRLIAEFLFLVISDAFRYNRESIEPDSANTNYVKKVCQYINRHYNENITVETLAQIVSLNKNYLIRLFNKELSTTPNQYILETRLFYARNLLLQTRLSIQDISLSCGFNTPSYFIKCFRTRYGQSPLVYRRTHCT